MKTKDEQVIRMVRGTRAMLLPHWGRIVATRQKDSSAASVVTALDEEVERYYARELKKIDPEADFVGEEFGGDRKAKRFWIADPIDGTAHYIRGLPFCTTMLALIEEARVNFSIIYDFINDIVYHARRGEGAYMNDERIHVSERPVTDSYAAYESQFEDPAKPENMEKFLKFNKKTKFFRAITSGYEYILVATGKLEGRICFNPYGEDYDYAPGSLLVSEAGGIVANIGSTKYDFNDYNFIAANKALYKEWTEGEDSIFPTLK
ncbi:MAG: inositol monophosphatase [Candidatus Pacebacteria bacterium]|nr:inositol monophosphatase [Candidatus Paceibacterota bacterium]